MIGTSDRLREQLACARQYQIPLSAFLNWKESDQDMALAYERYLAGICKECGTPREEWASDRQAYVADVLSCPGCETVGQAQRQIETNVPEGQRSGIFIQMIPRLVMERLDEERFAREDALEAARAGGGDRVSMVGD